MTEDLVLSDKVFKDNVFNIPINEIIRGEDYYNAVNDIRKGEGTMTGLPVLVKELGHTGKFVIIDGNHRVAEALINGDTKVKGMLDEKMYRKASDFIDKNEIPSFQKKTTQQRNPLDNSKFQGEMHAKLITLSVDLSNGVITKDYFDKNVLAIWNRVKDTLTIKQKTLIFGRKLEENLQKKFYEAASEKGVSLQN